jgi:hypothetical protein
MASRRAVWNPTEQAAAVEAYRLARAYEQQHPALNLQVHCTMRGVELNAKVMHLDEKGRLRVTQIARAYWQPGEVSERLVVEWGERALRAWLEGAPVVQQRPRP